MTQYSAIVEAATSVRPSRLMRVGIVGEARYPEAEATVYAKFKAWRSVGKKVSGKMLRYAMRDAVRSLSLRDGDDAFAVLIDADCERAGDVGGRIGGFKAGEHWLRRFLHRHSIVIRRATRRKANIAEDARDGLSSWYAFFRDVLQEAGESGGAYSSTEWGIAPFQRFGMDESPGHFNNSSTTTYEDKGADSVWVAHKAGSGGKVRRDFTIVLTHDMNGVLLPPTLIFRGQGKLLKKDEVEQWDKECHVLWQEKAWMDRATMAKFVELFLQDAAKLATTWPAPELIHDALRDARQQELERTGVASDDVFAALERRLCARPSVDAGVFAQERADVSLLQGSTLIMDNLDSHRADEIRQRLREQGISPRYLLENHTDRCQVVDAGLAKTFKDGITQEIDNLLDTDREFADKYFGWNDTSFTVGEMRVLVTKFAVRVWKRLQAHSAATGWIRKLAAKTGNLLTADGAFDSCIKVLPNFKVEANGAAEFKAKLAAAAGCGTPSHDDDDDADDNYGSDSDDDECEQPDAADFVARESARLSVKFDALPDDLEILEECEVQGLLSGDIDVATGRDVYVKRREQGKAPQWVRGTIDGATPPRSEQRRMGFTHLVRFDVSVDEPVLEYVALRMRGYGKQKEWVFLKPPPQHQQQQQQQQQQQGVGGAQAEKPSPQSASRSVGATAPTVVVVGGTNNTYNFNVTNYFEQPPRRCGTKCVCVNNDKAKAVSSSAECECRAARGCSALCACSHFTCLYQ
jgi:hypothetical protein